MINEHNEYKAMAEDKCLPNADRTSSLEVGMDTSMASFEQSEQQASMPEYESDRRREWIAPKGQLLEQVRDLTLAAHNQTTNNPNTNANQNSSNDQKNNGIMRINLASLTTEPCDYDMQSFYSCQTSPEHSVYHSPIGCSSKRLYSRYENRY